MADRPLIAVCLAPADLRPEVDQVTGRVRVDPRRADLPACEAAALEHGLRVAEAWGGSVLAVAAGPPDVDRALADAVAVGATALRLDWGSVQSGPGELYPGELAGDPASVAAALAAAIRTYGEPDLVVCGDRSAAHGIGAVPAFLAHVLGFRQALGLVRMETAPEGRRLLAERRLDGGWRESLSVVAPAVVSVEGAGVKLRRAGLQGALDAAPIASGSATVPVFRPSIQAAGSTSGQAAGLKLGVPRPYRPRTRALPAPGGETRDRLLAITGTLSNREPARVVGPLNASAAADELLAFLERSGYSLPSTSTSASTSTGG